jgi:L-threonylcarbamoyladenylate synthase
MHTKQVATQYVQATEPDAIWQTAVAVQAGQVVVIPTDTVYGVGCAALNADAIQALYHLKGRSFTKAIPILIADVADLSQIVSQITPLAQRLIAQHWPGPLTIVLPKHPQLPAALTPDDTIAVRLPDHDVARAVIRAAGGAMAVTSANLSGDPPAETAQEAYAALNGRVHIILDAGPAPQAQASTVVDCTGTSPIILRPGPITDL